MATLSPVSPARWFRTDLDVDRTSYVASGVLLMTLKYVVEVLLVGIVAHRFWTPRAFLSPLASHRVAAVGNDASALLFVLALFSMPFLFIGLSMSVRRAADAGLSPFVGLFFAVPVLNYAAMALLATLGSRPRRVDATRPAVDPPSLVRSTALGLGSSVGLGVAGGALAGVTGGYGVWLFFLLPIVMGVLCGYELNRIVDRGLRLTLSLAASAAFVTAVSFLLFGVEGAICILMVMPIGLVTVLVGAVVGRQLALSGARRAHGLASVSILPLVALLETATGSRPLHHVVTAVEVDASPERVFDEVVAFPEITSPRPWYFRTGIAVPLRARIEGTGVGAVRYCEFTTGAFVEPITAWERGRRLAFDVRSSPAPMEEWSPYRHLHPPHLDSTMRSRHGEFRMIPLAGGRTRLEGHTYYELGLEPDPYFALIADALVHRIHTRVLEHVAREVIVRRRGG